MDNNNKKIFLEIKCDIYWRTTKALYEWKDDDFKRSKEWFARCKIKAEHEHSLCKKCIER